MKKLLVIVLLALVSLAACGSQDDAEVRTARGEDPGQPGDVGLPEASARTAVGDESGEVRGSFSTIESDRRWDHICDRAIEEHLLDKAETPAARRPIIDALHAVEPLRVIDDEGRMVGYYTTRFVEFDEYDDVLDRANEVLAAAVAARDEVPSG